MSSLPFAPLDQRRGGVLGVVVVPAAGVVVVVVPGVVLVVPLPTPVPVPVVTPGVEVVPGVVLGVLMVGLVLVGGHGLAPRVEVVVPLVGPFVPAVGLGVVVVLVVPVVLPAPPTVGVVPTVEPDPDPIPPEDVVHGLVIVDWVDGDVVDVPMPVCDWVPTVCAANPIESVRLANVSHVVRILSS
ncbi:MAG: hypothetical protein JWO20_2776 [Candidatus Angelobacter sp.]|nr:hypothetical protein [Candidatus Angelobacter sp.]